MSGNPYRDRSNGQFTSKGGGGGRSGAGKGGPKDGGGMSKIPPLKPDPVADARIRTQAAERQAREAARSERDIQDAVNRSARAEQFYNPGNNRSAGSRGYGA